jgi:hypothetical protein
VGAISCSDPLAELIERRRQRRGVNFHSLGVPVVVIRRGDHQRNDARAGANIQWNPASGKFGKTGLPQVELTNDRSRDI